MRAVSAISTPIVIIVLLVANASAEAYWINVSPKTVKGFTVEAEIETNIPGAIVLSARLVYMGTLEEAGFVGTGFVRFNGIGGKARVTIDGCKTAEPRGFKLPGGDYNIEVFYYYMWPANTGTTSNTGISTNIKGIANLSLSDRDASSANGENGEDGLRWVMENVAAGDNWDPLFWRQKFGDLEEVEYRGKDNPKIHKMYYIRSIHVTLLIDEANSTILGYRMGLAHE